MIIGVIHIIVVLVFFWCKEIITLGGQWTKMLSINTKRLFSHKGNNWNKQLDVQLIWSKRLISYYYDLKV